MSEIQPETVSVPFRHKRAPDPARHIRPGPAAVVVEAEREATRHPGEREVGLLAIVRVVPLDPKAGLLGGEEEMFLVLGDGHDRGDGLVLGPFVVDMELSVERLLSIFVRKFHIALVEADLKF